MLPDESVVQRYPSHTSIFSGDLNLPDICWSNYNNGFTHLSPSNVCVPCFSESIPYFGLFQKNFIPNSHGPFLDFVFCNTNDVIAVRSSFDPLESSDIYHPPLGTNSVH